MKDKLSYRPEIDGLRALAVVPVILFHAGFKSFSGGFVGVDVFFVISGYLITSIIVKDLEAGAFTFSGFYERRAKRILPALFSIMIFCIPFAWIWMLPSDFKDFSTSVSSVVLFVSNILFWHQSGYFDTESELKPLLHTWSLAVEEQFYILFPLLLLFLWRFGKQVMIVSILIIAIVSFSVCEYSSIYDVNFNFYWAVTRAWELAIGSFVALVSVKPNILRDNVISTIGLVGIIIALFCFDRNTPFPSAFALLPVIGTALILLFATGSTLSGRVLSLPPLVAIGLISYSAYLWHQPLLAFGRIWWIYQLPAYITIGLCLVALVFAWATWRFIEIPWRRSKTKGPRSRRYEIVLPAIIVGGGLIAFGFGGYWTKGFRGAFFRPSIDERLLGQLEVASIDNGWCFYSIDTISSLSVGEQGLRCSLNPHNQATKNAVLFGDSFAGQYEPFWSIVGDKIGLRVTSITTNWCFPALNDDFPGPLSSRSFAQCQVNRKYIKENMQKYDVIILGGQWGRIRELGYLTDVMEEIRYVASAARIVVVMPSPTQYDIDVSRAYLAVKARHLEFSTERISKSNDILTREANQQLSDMAKKLANVLFIDRDELFNSDGMFSDASNGAMPYSSYNGHISIAGSRAAGDTFVKGPIYEDLRNRIGGL